MILVTGGSGLVGSHLIKRLANSEKQIRAIYRKKIPFNFKNVEWVESDILDVCSLQDAMQDVNQVYHCAAMVSFNPADKNQLLKINIEGTANVVNCCLANKVQKLLYVSSVAAIGKLNSNEMINENIVWNKELNKMIYGYSKHVGEMEVWRGIAEGLSAVIVNPSIILGYGDWNKSSCRLFKQVYNEFPWYTNGVNGFVDVDDVVTIAIELMNSSIEKERFIINAVNDTYKNIFTMIAEGFHKKPPIYKVTPVIASIVWRFYALSFLWTKKPPLITKETARNALSKNYYDNQKILKFLPDFKFKNIQESIRSICLKHLE